MRATAVTVHNNQTPEVFAEKRKDGFELWMVGPIRANDRAVSAMGDSEITNGAKRIPGLKGF